MSIVSSIGDLVNRLVKATSVEFTIGDKLETNQFAAYARMVEERARQELDRNYDPNVGRQRKDALIAVCRELAKRNGCDTGRKRTFWRRTADLLMLFKNDGHWAAAHGPCYGGHDRYLVEAYRLCSPDSLKKYWAEAKSHGFIVTINGKANNKRSIVTKSDQSIHVSGISFAPLLLLTEELQRHVNKWDETSEKIRSAHDDISNKVASLKRQLENCHLDETTKQSAHQLLHETEVQVSVAVAGRDVTTLSELHTELVTGARREKIPSSRAEFSPPHIIQTDSDMLSVVAWHEGCSEMDSSPPLLLEETDSGSDKYGLAGVSLSNKEMRSLFPDLIPYCPDIGRVAADSVAIQIARAVGISANQWFKACRQIGVAAASIAVIITGQRTIDGTVKTTAARYLSGMLAAARKDNLHLGSSLWGYRERNAAG